MTSHPGIVFRALSWNLFHGRDAPPGLSETVRSRLTRRPVRGERHQQVNVPLGDRFAALLAGWPWEVALLQEAPPRWLAPLGRRTGASGRMALTSRNQLPVLRSAVARRNPDLIRSHEGGSNMVLVRAPWQAVAAERVTLALRPERRRLLLVRLAGPEGAELTVACTHLSVPSTRRGPGEALYAASVAVEWSGGSPVVFGGDLNLRPAHEPELFAALAERFDLRLPTAPRSLDHLLARGLDPVSAPSPLAPERRDVAGPGGLAIRLSDHAPVTAAYGLA